MGGSTTPTVAQGAGPSSSTRSDAAGKRKVVPTPKVMETRSQKVGEASTSKVDQPMDVDPVTIIVKPRRSVPEVAVPIARKRLALTQPADDVPPASKLARVSQSSLAVRHPLPPSISSSSSRQVADAVSISSFSPVEVGTSMFGGPTMDPIMMRLKMLEDTMQRNHEDGMRRLDEIRRLYEMELSRRGA
jgi:hypothetical protein